MLVSFFLNFAWEFLQSPFYSCFKNSLESNYFHYLMAILWDSMYTILIYATMSAINKNWLWIKNPVSSKNISAALIIWLLLAIFIEYKWVFILWKWSYSSMMPTLFGIWIVPLLQMMILPIISFKLANAFLKKEIR
ncbi:MAG: hypothetical protein ACD_2C00083G0003 [uncultured bacterium (gcode 4)]|uniref:Rod shape-determining protein MreD n=1 Tax=uncultured bacterium (gcode 4) TaxID=1234023 RepID=K2H202_9BACT|nr:MAG: hypothetical protein ACD_2C00083G0003 [uncultured bacterium (gcode 4)]